MEELHERQARYYALERDQLKCALPECTQTFAMHDAWNITGGVAMAGDHRISGYGANHEHLACSFEHALEAFCRCAREHWNHAERERRLRDAEAT